MKFSFKRTSAKKTGEEPESKDSLRQRLDKANLRLQYKCADWLEQKTAHWTSNHWMAILCCYVLFTMGCSTYLIVDGFWGIPSKTITIISITRPNNAVADKKQLRLNIPASADGFKKIIRFRKYIDSLGLSPTGQKSYDSIVSHRPGLIDSLIAVEHYYQSQFKK
jgi:hypothetical protein